MPVFDYHFIVAAPLDAVNDFHKDTSALKRLTPPPVFVQLHHVEPLSEGSISEFTMWFAFFPVRWTAVHTNVNQNGFMDTQENGLLAKWQHTHRFIAITPGQTRIEEHIEYEHRRDWRGVVSRVLFAPPALYALFIYRRWVTRQALSSSQR